MQIRTCLIWICWQHTHWILHFLIICTSSLLYTTFLNFFTSFILLFSLLQNLHFCVNCSLYFFTVLLTLCWLFCTCVVFQFVVLCIYQSGLVPADMVVQCARRWHLYAPTVQRTAWCGRHSPRGSVSTYWNDARLIHHAPSLCVLLKVILHRVRV